MLCTVFGKFIHNWCKAKVKRSGVWRAEVSSFSTPEDGI